MKIISNNLCWQLSIAITLFLFPAQSINEMNNTRPATPRRIFNTNADLQNMVHHNLDATGLVALSKVNRLHRTLIQASGMLQFYKLEFDIEQIINKIHSNTIISNHFPMGNTTSNQLMHQYLCGFYAELQHVAACMVGDSRLIHNDESEKETLAEDIIKLKALLRDYKAKYDVKPLHKLCNASTISREDTIKYEQFWSYQQEIECYLDSLEEMYGDYESVGGMRMIVSSMKMIMQIIADSIGYPEISKLRLHNVNIERGWQEVRTTFAGFKLLIHSESDQDDEFQMRLKSIVGASELCDAFLSFLDRFHNSYHQYFV